MAASHGGHRAKVAVLALGAAGLLAAAITARVHGAPVPASALGPVPPVTTPASAQVVVGTVPKREPGEAEARQALAAAPDDVGLAVKLARVDISRYRALADPRYLGRAQATLGRWWTQAAPPPDVRFLRATILQATHVFLAARADLDALIAIEPSNIPTQLTRAVVATVTADYAAARASCEAIAPRVSEVVEAACIGPLETPTAGYDRLARALGAAQRVDPIIEGWADTTLAELAIRRGDWTSAERHARAALRLDDTDHYARDLVADILLATKRPADASALLAGREVIDSHLLRRAIAEYEAKGPEATQLVGQMRGRIAEAAERGDRVHAREEARFALVVEHDAPRALKIAIENWGVQKELADARLLVEAAIAAGQPRAADVVRTWRETNQIGDLQLETDLERVK